MYDHQTEVRDRYQMDRVVGEPRTLASVTAQASLAQHNNTLAELIKRLDERVEQARALADFVSGSHPEPKANGPGPVPVPNGLGAEMGERIVALDMRVNALCHEFGRLQRAILG